MTGINLRSLRMRTWRCSFTARASSDAHFLEATAARHQHDTLAARALELENRMNDPGQQLATIAAQIASAGIVETNLFQCRVHDPPSASA